MLAFANKVAAALERRYPDRGFLFYAYQATLLPPTEMKVHRNLCPMIAPLNICNVHPMSSACPDRVKMRKVYDGWAKMTGGRFAWYSYTNNGVFVVPGVKMMADEIRYLHARGCFTSFRERMSAPNVGWHMIGWVESKLMWDVNQDVRLLRRQFIEGYYGRLAADHIERVYETVETGLIHSPTALPPRKSGPHPHMTFWPFDKIKPYIQPAIPEIKEAIKLAESEAEPFRGRILRDMKTLLGEAEIVPKRDMNLLTGVE